MDKIFTIKERILQFVENQKIKKKDFYSQTEIRAANFKGIGLKSEIGGNKLVKILTIYPQINAEWLLLGKGEMLKKYENKQALSILAEESEVYGVVNYKEKYFETLEKLNQANERLLALTDIKKELIKKK